MEQNTYSRKQLYDLVWSEPSAIIAERHGISEHIFKTICRKHQIHQPRKGHWSKVRHGRPVKIIPFQVDFAGSDLVRVVPKEKVTEKWRKKSPRMLRRKDIDTSCKELLIVPNKLRSPDPRCLETKNKNT